MRANLFNRLEKSFLSTKKILLVLLIFSFLAFLTYSEECLIYSATLEIRNSTGEIDPENNNLVCGEKTKFNITVIGRQQNCKSLYLDIYINDGIIISNEKTSVSDIYYVYSYWLWNYEYSIPPSATSLTFKAVIRDENRNTLLTLKKQIKVKCQSQCTFQSISVTPNSIDCNSGDNFNIEISLSRAQNCNGKRLEIKNGTFSKSCTLDSNNICTVTFTKSELKQQGFDGQVIFDVYIDNQKTGKQVSITFRNCQPECPLGSSCIEGNLCGGLGGRIVGSCSLGVCCAPKECSVEGEECSPNRDCCSGHGLKCINGICKKTDCVVENLKIEKFTQLVGRETPSCDSVYFEINVSGTQKGCNNFEAIILTDNKEIGKIPCTIVGNTFYCYEKYFKYSTSQPGNINFEVRVFDKSVSQNVMVNCIQSCTDQQPPNYYDKDNTCYYGCEVKCENGQWVRKNCKEDTNRQCEQSICTSSGWDNSKCSSICKRNVPNIKTSAPSEIILVKEFYEENSEIYVDIALNITEKSLSSCSISSLKVKVEKHSGSGVSVLEPFKSSNLNLVVIDPLLPGEEKNITFRIIYTPENIKKMFREGKLSDNIEVSITLSSSDGNQYYSGKKNFVVVFRSDEGGFCILKGSNSFGCRDGLRCLSTLFNSYNYESEGKCYDPYRFVCENNVLNYNHKSGSVEAIQNNLYYEISSSECYDLSCPPYSGKKLWWSGAYCCNDKEFCNGFSACGVEKRSYCNQFVIRFEVYEDGTKCGLWPFSEDCAKIHLKLDGKLLNDKEVLVKCKTSGGKEIEILKRKIEGNKVYEDKYLILEITGDAYKNYLYCSEVEIIDKDTNEKKGSYIRPNPKKGCEIISVGISPINNEVLEMKINSECVQSLNTLHVYLYFNKDGKQYEKHSNCFRIFGNDFSCQVMLGSAGEFRLDLSKVLKDLNLNSVEDLGKIKIMACPSENKDDPGCREKEIDLSQAKMKVSFSSLPQVNTLGSLNLESITKNNLGIEIKDSRGVSIQVSPTDKNIINLEKDVGFGRKVNIYVYDESRTLYTKFEYIVGAPLSINLRKGWNLCYIPFGGTRILLEKNKNDIISVFYLYDKNKWIRYLPTEDEFALTQKGRKTQISFEEYEEKILPYSAAWIYSTRPLTINSIEIKDYEIEIQPNKWYILGIRNIRNISVSVSIGGLYLLWYVNDKGYLYDAISNRVWEKICDSRIGKCEWREVIEESTKENILSIGNPCKAYFVIAVSERVKDKIKVMFGT